MPKRVCPHCAHLLKSRTRRRRACPLPGLRPGHPDAAPAARANEKIKLTVTPPPPEIYQAPQLADIARQIITNVERVIVGKSDQVTLAVVGLFAEGHILFEDVPGVAKTMLSRAIAQSVGCTFKRIQCTPDLQPEHVVGDFILDPTHRPERFPLRPAVFADGAGGRDQPRQPAHAIGAA